MHLYNVFLVTVQQIYYAGNFLFTYLIQSTLEYGSSAYVHCLSEALYNKLTGASRLALQRIVFFCIE